MGLFGEREVRDKEEGKDGGLGRCWGGLRIRGIQTMWWVGIKRKKEGKKKEADGEDREMKK